MIRFWIYSLIVLWINERALWKMNKCICIHELNRFALCLCWVLLLEKSMIASIIWSRRILCILCRQQILKLCSIYGLPSFLLIILGCRLSVNEWFHNGDRKDVYKYHNFYLTHSKFINWIFIILDLLFRDEHLPVLQEDVHWIWFIYRIPAI